MMRKLLAGLAVAAVLAVAAPRVALAHHAMQAEFDQNNVVVISGVLKKVNWVNPHVNFLLDVTEPDGKVTTWTLVHAGPGALRAAGLSATPPASRSRATARRAAMSSRSRRLTTSTST